MANNQKKKRFHRVIDLKKLGPGVITGASDDDPSGIATYSQAGAQFGLSFLWTALLTYPLMFSVQAMCAKIGIVTSAGLVKTFKIYYPKIVTYLLVLLIIPAIILNIGADLAGMSAVSSLLFPGISPIAYDFLIVSILIIGIIFFPYKKIASILKFFLIAFLAYFIVPFLIKINWLQVTFHTFVPSIEPTQEYFVILVAILGTTISPYLFFWQSFMSMENFRHNTDSIHRDIHNMNLDVNIGMIISNLVMFFVILTTGSTLFPAGIKNIETVEQAAMALEPLAGTLAYEVFSIGILGSGFIAIPVLAICVGYICGELFDWKFGLDTTLKEAPKFYGTIILTLFLGFILNLFGIDPIQSLILAAIVYGITAPVFIGMILLVCNNKKIMGRYTNSLRTNLVGLFTLLLMLVTSLGLIYFNLIG